MIGSKYLTGETIKQGITFPGQAHFAIPGATEHCVNCWYWARSANATSAPFAEKPPADSQR